MSSTFKIIALVVSLSALGFVLFFMRKPAEVLPAPQEISKAQLEQLSQDSLKAQQERVHIPTHHSAEPPKRK